MKKPSLRRSPLGKKSRRLAVPPPRLLVLEDRVTPAALSINDMTTLEGQDFVQLGAFTVTLDAPSASTVTVQYSSANGSATAGSDYTGVSGTLTFNPGETSKPVSVSIFGDTTPEADETFFINLFNASNATIADNQGIGTILNDDANITINDVSVVEGTGGSNNALVTVSLSHPSAVTTTVLYQTSNGTAAAPGDYTTSNGTVTFLPGVTTQQIGIPIVTDSEVEANETFFVNLSMEVNGTITDALGQVTILDDDLTVSIGDVSVTEGNAGTVNAVFTVSLSATSLQTVTVDFATADGTAVAPGDYVTGSGTLTFAPGETTKSVIVAVNGDTLDELDETFFVNLSNASNATIADNQGQGTITDDDPTPGLSINDVVVLEGNSGTTNAMFQVSLSAASGQTVTVQFATLDGTAVAPGDYFSASGTLIFAPGETTKSILVTVNGDTLNEAIESYFVNLSSPSNATLTDGQGQGTIINDDAPPSLSIGDVAVIEGNSGTVNAVFTVTLSPAGGQTVTVDFATADGSASSPGDYIPTSGTLTFAPGESTKTVIVLVNGDILDELDEIYFVNLSNAGNATIGDAQGQGTIIDDDAPPSLTINDVSVTEGNAGTSTAVFTVSLSAPSGQTVTVDFATADGTAVAPGDYASGNGTLTFAPGETTKTVTVQVNGDTTNEADETFFLNLTNAGNATIGDNQGQGTIVNDDGLPSITINDVSVTEGNIGTVAATFTVTLSASSGQTVTVNFATADGTAVAPGDYASGIGTVMFAPGETTKMVTVQVNGDTTNEADETFFLNLTNASNGTIGDAQGLGTIVNDDGLPSITINDVSVTEGNAGTTNAVFTVTLSAPSGQTVTVNFATADGTAVAPGDYASGSGALTFAPGETTKTVTVQVNGDTTNEADETFFLNLSNADNATIGDNQGQGTIVNDDAAPSLLITDVSVTEGDAGTTNAVFTVTLSAASGQTVTVDFATANGTAAAPSDFASGTGTLTFAPGETTKTITVAVSGDTLDEANETFFVNLSNASNATIGDAQGQGTIVDDDAAPSLSINDVSVTEGNAGTTSATFTVTLSAPSGQTVTVNFATADGTAVAPGDYASGSGALTFAPGETTKTVTVTVNGDTTNEADETFFVNLSGASNATISDAQGQGSIVNDDGLPSITINDVSVTEGNAGTTNATFTVTLSAPSGQTVTVNFATADGTAVAPGDYASGSGALTFAPGETTKTVTVQVNGDTTNEANETFFLNLSGAGNATIGDAQGQGTIVNDDAAPSLSIDDVSITEGNSGTTTASFTVSLSAPSGLTVTVNFATADGTAMAPGDYVSGSGALTFAPGETSKTVTVTVNGDLLNEADETFFVNLSAPTNATIADNQGQGTIVNDDDAPSLSINDVSVTEGNAGTTSATFTVTLSAPSGQTVTVNFATADGTAVAPGDYASGSGALTFAPGETTKTVTVQVNGDTNVEPTENYFVNLSGATNATVSDSQGQGTIVNDDSGGGLTPVATKDDGEWNYREFGPWTPVTSTAGYKGDYRSTPSGGSSRMANWILPVTSGVYEVFVSYPVAPTNLSNAAYTVSNGNTPAFSATRDQRVAPDDGTFAGVAWESLGVVNCTTGLVVVQVSTTTLLGDLIADGVALVPVGSMPQRASLEKVDAEAAKTPLSNAALAPIVRQARAAWAATGITPAQQAALAAVQFYVSDLPDTLLGAAAGRTVWIDHTAAGHGWFVDPTPANNSEFGSTLNGRAAGRMDLLTVVTHELGHVLGYDSLEGAQDAHSLMAAVLAPGVRRTPTTELVSTPVADSADGLSRVATSRPRAFAAESIVTVGGWVGDSTRAGAAKVVIGNGAARVLAADSGAMPIVDVPNTPRLATRAEGLRGRTDPRAQTLDAVFAALESRVNPWQAPSDDGE